MNKDKFGIKVVKSLFSSAKLRFMSICFLVNLNLNFQLNPDVSRVRDSLMRCGNEKNDKHFMAIIGLKVSSDGKDDFFPFNS